MLNFKIINSIVTIISNSNTLITTTTAALAATHPINSNNYKVYKQLLGIDWPYMKRLW